MYRQGNGRYVYRNNLTIRLLGALAAAILTLIASQSSNAAPAAPEYKIVAWNTLGMHCYNRDCSDLMVLPPYNTLWAQVIKVGDVPEIVTAGVKVEYSFPQNTFSAGKTNFWQYANSLLGVSPPLNIGLAGKGLAGTMDHVGDHFEAVGIPLTEYRDNYPKKRDPATWSRYPYQLADITVRDAATNAILTKNVAVAPVSSELNCQNCHADDGDATTTYPITPTGKVETNILALHDYLNQGKYDPPLMDSRPVLCAKCHASAALGLAGEPNVSNLSNAMHNHHKDLPDITPDTDGCYNCHPGPQTQCLRDAMTQNLAFNCTTCHGAMAQVSLNPSPWVNEPRCDSNSCHGAGAAMNKPLYRDSQGHGGMYCAACHDSPHAIAKSRESNDAIKFRKLQGYAGTLRKCTVCHATMPTQPFVHVLK